VDYLYSLYDALVSINVPNDKARAVVDAMERDMGTTIATKSDLQMLQQATKADLQLLRQELISALSQFVTKDELQTVRADIAELRQDNALIRKDMEILSTRIDMVSNTITVRLGSMQVVGLGLLFAALKLT
jgi:hypothetical protein